MLRDSGNIRSNEIGELSNRTLTPVQAVDDYESRLVGECFQHPSLLPKDGPLGHSRQYMAIWPNRQQSKHRFSGYCLVAVRVPAPVTIQSVKEKGCESATNRASLRSRSPQTLSPKPYTIIQLLRRRPPDQAGMPCALRSVSTSLPFVICRATTTSLPPSFTRDPITSTRSPFVNEKPFSWT